MYPFVQVFSIWITLLSGATAELTCDTLLLLSTNLTGECVLIIKASILLTDPELYYITFRNLITLIIHYIRMEI